MTGHRVLILFLIGSLMATGLSSLVRADQSAILEIERQVTHAHTTNDGVRSLIHEVIQTGLFQTR